METGYSQYKNIIELLKSLRPLFEGKLTRHSDPNDCYNILMDEVLKIIDSNENPAIFEIVSVDL